MTVPPPAQGQNPYAQAPTGQPAAPGTPQQPYAPFPQQQGAPVPPPPPSAGKRAGKKALRIVGLIVVAVIIAIIKFGIGWWASETDAETTSVGSCMHNDGTTSDPKLNEVDCSSGNAQYKVVQKFDGSTDDSKCEPVKEATISFVQYGNGHDVVLCLKETK